MSGTWDFYFARVNDALSSIFVDLSAREHAPDPSRPHLLWVWIPLRIPREDGLSSAEEATALNALEDTLTAAVVSAQKAVFVGRITGAGRRELYFYAPHAEDLSGTVDQVFAALPDYSPSWGDQPDPQWSQYLNLLYPNARELQRIKNRHVLDALRVHGDTLEKARPVTHWIYFAEAGDRDRALTALRSQGFTAEESQNAAEEDAYPHGLRVERVDHVHQEAIDATVSVILDAIEGLDADYDGWECPVET